MNNANAHVRNPWPAMAVLALGLFMTLLDLTIVNVAIPSIIDGLGASLDQVLWVLNAYSLVYAVLLITSGRLGDIFGPRNLFAAGVALFTTASLASGFAHDPVQLIVARAAQGLGAALIAPQGLPIMTTLFPPERRSGVFAIYGALAGLAVVLGPTLGGFLVTNFGWQWIFFVNLPVGLLTLVLAFVFVPDLRPGRKHRLDLAGVALATVGLLGIVFGLIEGQRYDWSTVVGPITIPEIIASGIALLALFVVYEARRQDREPLLPFAVFRDRNYTLMNLVLAAMGFAMLGVFLPLTIYFQSVLGLSAIEAGLAIVPMPVAMFFASGLVAGTATRIEPKYVLLTGLTLFAAGVAYIVMAAQPDSDRWTFVPGLVVAGIGMACTWTPVYNLATRDLRPELAGVASGVLNTIQELGGVLASAAVGAVLQNRLAIGLHEQAVGRADRLPPGFRAPFVDAFTNTRGFEVGAGQTGASLPAGLPADVAATLRAIGHEVFAYAFVDAMRPAMLLAIAAVVLGIVATAAVRRRARAMRVAEVAA